MNRFIKFIPAPLSSLDNGLYAGMMVKFVDLVTATTEEKLGVTESMAVLKPLVNKMSDFVMRSYKFVETDKLKDLDLKRDSIYTHIFQAIRAEVKSPITARAEAANTLNTVLNTYYNSRATGLSYDKETALINGLLIDAAKPENAAHIVTLGLKEAVDGLKAVQGEFALVLNTRSTSRTKVFADKSVELRKNIDVCYDVTTDMIFAKSVLEPSAEITEFINQWNMRITETKATYNLSTALKKAAKKKQSEQKSGEDGGSTSGRPPAENPTDASAEVKA